MKKEGGVHLRKGEALRVTKKIKQGQMCWGMHAILKLGRPRQEDCKSEAFFIFTVRKDE